VYQPKVRADEGLVEYWREGDADHQRLVSIALFSAFMHSNIPMVCCAGYHFNMPMPEATRSGEERKGEGSRKGGPVGGGGGGV